MTVASELELADEDTVIDLPDGPTEYHYLWGWQRSVCGQFEFRIVGGAYEVRCRQAS